MPLSDTAIRNAKPCLKPVKLFDERGLFLLITPAGGKWWRFRFRFDSREKLLSLGVYPDVGLKEARNRRDAARKLLAEGIDPGTDRKAQKAVKQDRVANSFEVVAREWYEKFSPNWVNHHGQRVIRRFERDIFPWIGSKPIADVTASELLAVVRRIEGRGALETAHRALGNCSQVLRYSIATGRCTHNPAGDLRGALPPTNAEHFAAVTEPAQAAALMRALDAYEGTFTVACALRLAPYVFARPGELRKAEWADFDLDAAEWRYMVTKTNTAHIVPLAAQAVTILRELYPLTGTGRFVFPGARSNKRPMSDNAILAAMRRMGISKNEMSGHGFRAMARTILDEVLGVRPDFIEHQLAHTVKDPNGRAYNRTTYLPERREMMQQWADYLDKLKADAELAAPQGAGV
jgi:integrase